MEISVFLMQVNRCLVETCIYVFNKNLFLIYSLTLIAQMIKNPPAMLETQVRSLGRKILWKGKQQPTPELLPGIFSGQGSLVGYNPWNCKEGDMTEQLLYTLNLQFSTRLKIDWLKIDWLTITTTTCNNCTNP